MKKIGLFIEQGQIIHRIIFKRFRLKCVDVGRGWGRKVVSHYNFILRLSKKKNCIVIRDVQRGGGARRGMAWTQSKSYTLE